MATSLRATRVPSAYLLTVAWLFLLAPASGAAMVDVAVNAVPPPLDFFSLTPCRVVDTRTGGSPLLAGIERTFALAGVCGIPSTAAAVSINVAVTQPTAAGNVRLYPAGSSVPTVSTINYSAGQTRTNNTIIGLGAAGELAAQNQPAGSTHLILDVNGYFEGGCPTPTRSCYDGPPDTEGVGICSPGIQTCVSGTYGPCIGQVLPSEESCNDVDDDCDGQVDEDFPNTGQSCTVGVGACQASGTVVCLPDGSGTACNATAGTPTAEVCGDGIDNDCDGATDEECSCVHVAPSGDDITGTGTSFLPKRTISAAIAIAGTLGFANTVCVASGGVCPSTFDYTEVVTMRNGIHVYGGYQAFGTTWPRPAGCVTRIVDQDQRGVYFDATVTATTILDGFTIVGTNDPTNAAVTVAGSTGAVIDNDVILGGIGTTSYGVNVIDSAGTPATPTISNSGITGGNGTALAVGVRSLNSAPVIQGNCSGFDASGRCSASCLGEPRFIGGRTTGGNGAESYGVRLEASPGAVVDQNSICSNGTSTTNAAGVRLSGDATGSVVRANNILGSGGQQDAVGVWADPCAGSSPSVLNNFRIAASSATPGAHSYGIRAVGSCDVSIEHNVQIIGGEASAGAAGVYCGKDAVSGVASGCIIRGNVAILGSSAGFPETSIGILCDDAACAVIQDNGINGRGGQTSIGVALGRTGTLVDANVIHAGCATSVGIGLSSNDSFARIQNNQIFGATSVDACTPTGGLSTAVDVSLGPANEIDLNSNDIFGEGFAGACVSRGITFSGGSAIDLPRGIVRNNIVFAGKCDSSINVVEASAFSDPRLLQNNDLVPKTAGAVLYRNEASTNLTSIFEVNDLGLAPTASGNISADPLHVGGHLSAGSPCRNAGTATGAPNDDFEGDPRPQESVFDIGRDEYKP